MAYRIIPLEIVLKEHAPYPHVPKRKHSNVDDRNEIRVLVEQHKRTIRETHLASNYFPELTRFRKTFLRYDLADKNAKNRAFFDKWLTHPVVEAGWSPAGGWTLERISELHADVENVKA